MRAILHRHGRLWRIHMDYGTLLPQAIAVGAHYWASFILRGRYRACRIATWQQQYLVVYFRYLFIRSKSSGLWRDNNAYEFILHDFCSSNL